MPAELTTRFFEADAPAVARALIGCALLVEGCGGTIVETEAYTADDPASHSFRGHTRRNAAMFGPPGHAYVYRSYGIHWMLNLVCGAEGDGQAVLVRALIPTAGRETIAARRPGSSERDWCRGPGRIGVALAIGPRLDGVALGCAPFSVLEPESDPTVLPTRRIGISRAVERPWRFLLVGAERFVSVAPGR